MKKLILVFFLLPQLLWGQTIRKANDSTVYRYLVIRKNISLDSLIPKNFGEYSRSKNMSVASQDVDYEKLIDSFPVVGIRNSNWGYHAEDAYAHPATATTIDEDEKKYLSNFFFREKSLVQKNVLLFNSQTRQFLVKSVEEISYSTPYIRWLIFLLVYVVFWNMLKGDEIDNDLPFRRILIMTVVVNIWTGVWFWLCFGWTPFWPDIWQRIAVWFVRWGIIIALYYACRAVQNNKAKKKTEQKLKQIETISGEFI